MHVDEKEGDALVRRSVAISAREQEALVRVVSAARPRLLSVQDPTAIPRLGSRSQAGQVTAGVGLAEALAEDQLTAEDLLDIRLTLPGRPKDEQGRSQQAHPEPAQDDGSSSLGHLLLVDGLHDGRGGTATRLDRPGELQPACLMQATLPLPLKVALLLLAVAPDAAVPPLLRKVALEPAPDLLAKAFLF